LKNILYQLFWETRCDRLLWRFEGKGLRILAYHGVCQDRIANEAWVPKHFVKQSAFADQLAYLRDNAVVLPLSDAIARLNNRTLPERCVSLTFDDGYANNLYIAFPVLQAYGLVATIFLTTGCVESGDFFPFDRFRLIQQSTGEGLHQNIGSDDRLPDHKRNPLDPVLQRADKRWRELTPHLTQDQKDALRPLRVEEILHFDGDLIEFGAHGHSHCILRNETRARRDEEITLSIDRVARWTGKATRTFSYPNGQLGDFDGSDKQLLRARGIEAAVTGVPGRNQDGRDLLELKRYPVGIYHGKAGFVTEVTGFRTALRSIGKGVE
jgi:peptidoglycan/xylan/chitin deacetylase (PgdA/CDA1 family)